MSKSLLKQYREFVAAERERNPTTTKKPNEPENDRKKRQPAVANSQIPANLLNFGQDLAMEKKWMEAYYPGAFQVGLSGTGEQEPGN